VGEPGVPPRVIGVPRFELGTSPTRTERATRLRHTPSPNRVPERLTQSLLMARRDEILEFAAELLDLDTFRDHGPQGMQVAGTEEVSRIVCAVSSSLELFERAAEARAQLVIVHHGLLWDNEPRVIDARVRRRLQALFDGDLTLAGYHLALDAHPEVGNNVLLARELGVEVDAPFAGIGAGGRLPAPAPVESFLARVRERIAPEPLVFREGPDEVERVAIVSGGGGRHLAEAAAAGYDLFLTGEPEEPSLHLARELEITFVAAGHYATERLGVQALAARLADRFGLEWEFVELPNPV
jgi:dinuclear metal center YbgI/SA1388 family protein